MADEYGIPTWNPKSPLGVEQSVVSSKTIDRHRKMAGFGSVVLAGLVMRCLAKPPENRPASLDEGVPHFNRVFQTALHESRWGISDVGKWGLVG
jgi:hypothetical protein